MMRQTRTNVNSLIENATPDKENPDIYTMIILGDGHCALRAALAGMLLNGLATGNKTYTITFIHNLQRYISKENRESIKTLISEYESINSTEACKIFFNKYFPSKIQNLSGEQTITSLAIAIREDIIANIKPINERNKRHNNVNINPQDVKDQLKEDDIKGSAYLSPYWLNDYFDFKEINFKLPINSAVDGHKNTRYDDDPIQYKHENNLEKASHYNLAFSSTIANSIIEKFNNVGNSIKPNKSLSDHDKVEIVARHLAEYFERTHQKSYSNFINQKYENSPIAQKQFTKEKFREEVTKIKIENNMLVIVGAENKIKISSFTNVDELVNYIFATEFNFAKDELHSNPEYCYILCDLLREILFSDLNMYLTKSSRNLCYALINRMSEYKSQIKWLETASYNEIAQYKTLSTTMKNDEEKSEENAVKNAKSFLVDTFIEKYGNENFNYIKFREKSSEYPAGLSFDHSTPEYFLNLNSMYWLVGHLASHAENLYKKNNFKESYVAYDLLLSLYDNYTNHIDTSNKDTNTDLSKAKERIVSLKNNPSVIELINKNSSNNYASKIKPYSTPTSPSQTSSASINHADNPTNKGFYDENITKPKSPALKKSTRFKNGIKNTTKPISFNDQLITKTVLTGVDDFISKAYSGLQSRGLLDANNEIDPNFNLDKLYQEKGEKYDSDEEYLLILSKQIEKYISNNKNHEELKLLNTCINDIKKHINTLKNPTESTSSSLAISNTKLINTPTFNSFTNYIKINELIDLKKHDDKNEFEMLNNYGNKIGTIKPTESIDVVAISTSKPNYDQDFLESQFIMYRNYFRDHPEFDRHDYTLFLNTNNYTDEEMTNIAKLFVYSYIKFFFPINSNYKYHEIKLQLDERYAKAVFEYLNKTNDNSQEIEWLKNQFGLENNYSDYGNKPILNASSWRSISQHNFNPEDDQEEPINNQIFAAIKEPKQYNKKPHRDISDMI